MRRFFWRALVVGVAVLPVVVVVGHPVLSAMLVEDRGPRRSFGGLTAGVAGHKGRLDGLEVTQRHYRIGGVWGVWVTATGRNEKSDPIPMHVRLYPDMDRDYEESLVTWSPGIASLEPGRWDSGVTTIAYGWPWVSAAVDYDGSEGLQRFVPLAGGGVVAADPAINGFALVMSPLVVDRMYEFERCVPTRVVWGGAFGNLAVYAAACWLVVLPTMLVPGWVRRRVRTRKGLCPACGYAFEGLTVCPECGAERPFEKVIVSCAG